MEIVTEEITLSQKRNKFLDDMLVYYSTNPRGCVGERKICYYSSNCAIGRLLDDDLCRELDSQPSAVRYIFHKLPIALQELGVDFLESIQILHDTDSNWDESGLNSYGIEQANIIRENILSGQPKI